MIKNYFVFLPVMASCNGLNQSNNMRQVHDRPKEISRHKREVHLLTNNIHNLQDDYTDSNLERLGILAV